MNQHARRMAGLTIIEVLIAIAVIGVVFAVLAALQVSNLRVTAASRDDSTVLQAAVQGFEVVRARVLANYSGFADDCQVGAQAERCTGSFDASIAELPTQGQDPRVDVSYSIVTGDYSENSTTVWLIRVDVSSAIEGVVPPFVLRQFVSCLDADVQPTMTPPIVACGTGS